MVKTRKTKSNISKLLHNKTILITGGAGSIASGLVKQLVNYSVKAIRVLDIDEHALFVLGRSINDKRVRLLLGNILDKERINMAGIGVDIIIHTAAIKNIAKKLLPMVKKGEEERLKKRRENK